MPQLNGWRGAGLLFISLASAAARFEDTLAGYTDTDLQP